MIDCDIHVQIGDREQFLGFVEPGQRDWFREQGPLLGTPGYTWVHPTGFMRAELEPGAGGMPASTPDLVRRELLDPYGIDIGLLTADDGIAVSLMASPYRAAAYARAHNDWLRDCWLDADPRLRGTIVVPAQDPLAAAEEINRVATGRSLRGGAAVRRLGAPLRRSALPAGVRRGGGARPARRHPLRC